MTFGKGRFNVLFSRFSTYVESCLFRDKFPHNLAQQNESAEILKTPGARLHAIGGIETHIHIATSLPPNILVSDWVGKLKGSSSYYINHEVEPKALEWQRGYGIVTFGTKDLQWVIEYINDQKEHHKKGTTNERLEKFSYEEEDG